MSAFQPGQIVRVPWGSMIVFGTIERFEMIGRDQYALVCIKHGDPRVDSEADECFDRATFPVSQLALATKKDLALAGP